MAGNRTPNPPRPARWAPNGAPSVTPRAQYAGRPNIALSRTVTVIGAREGARLHLVSSTVSNVHAVLVNAATGAYIRDLASRTHVIVNGHTVRESDLNDGDRLQVGKFEFRFNAGNPAVFAQSGLSAAEMSEPAPAAVLRVDGAPVAIPITDRTVVIGRRPTCDIPLLEESASTIHAILFEMNGRRYVRDLMSRTGVFVNGEKIDEQAEVAVGDEIRVGDTTIRYLAADEAEVPQRAAVPEDDAGYESGVAADDADDADAPIPLADLTTTGAAAAARRMAPPAMAGDDVDAGAGAGARDGEEGDRAFTDAVEATAAAPADEHGLRDAVDLGADPDVAGPGETVEIPAAAVARHAARPPTLSELVVDDEAAPEPDTGDPADDVAPAAGAARVYARAGDARAHVEDAAEADAGDTDDVQPRRGWRGMVGDDSAVLDADADAEPVAEQQPAGEVADAEAPVVGQGAAATGEEAAAEDQVSLAADVALAPAFEPGSDVESAAEVEPAPAAEADVAAPVAESLELTAEEVELPLPVADDDAAVVTAAGDDDRRSVAPEAPAEPALDLSADGTAAAEIAISTGDADDTAGAVDLVLPTSDAPAATAAAELAPAPHAVEDAADRRPGEERAADPFEAPPIAPLAADVGIESAEPPPVEIAPLDLSTPAVVDEPGQADEADLVAARALPLGDAVAPLAELPPIVDEPEAPPVAAAADEAPAEQARWPLPPRNATPMRRPPPRAVEPVTPSEASDVEPPIAESAEPAASSADADAAERVEVIDATEPTPESALGFDVDAVAASPVDPPPAVSLSDSTFGRVIEDFSGPSAGPLVEAGPDDTGAADTATVAERVPPAEEAELVDEVEPAAAPLDLTSDVPSLEDAALPIVDAGGNEAAAPRIDVGQAPEPEAIELPELRFDVDESDVEAFAAPPADDEPSAVAATDAPDSDGVTEVPPLERELAAAAAEIEAESEAPPAGPEPDVAPAAASPEAAPDESPAPAPPRRQPPPQPPRRPAPALGGPFGWGANQEHFLGGMPLSLGSAGPVAPSPRPAPPSQSPPPRAPRQQPPLRPAARGPAGAAAPAGRSAFDIAPKRPFVEGGAGRAVPPFAGGTTNDARRGQVTTGFDGLAMPPVRETDVFSQMSTPTAFASGLAPGAIADVFGGRAPMPGDHLAAGAATDPARRSPPAAAPAPVPAVPADPAATDSPAVPSPADRVWADDEPMPVGAAASGATAAEAAADLDAQGRARPDEPVAADVRRAGRHPGRGHVPPPPAPPPGTAAAAPAARPRRRWFGIRGLLVLTVLFAAAAAAAVYHFLPERATLEGTLAFRRFDALKEIERRNLLAEQKKFLADPALRNTAAEILTGLRPDSSPGFLDDAGQFARTAATAAWSPTEPGALVIRHEGSSSVAERARVHALMTALYQRNQDLAAVASDVRAEVDRLTAAHERTLKRLEELKQAAERQRAATDTRPPATEAAQLEAEATRLEEAWNAALARVKGVEADLERIRQSMPAEPQPAGSADAPVVDPDLAELEDELTSLNERIAAARDARGRVARDARGALDAALVAFEREIAAARGTMAGNPGLAAYVAAAEKLHASTRELTDQLAQRQQRDQARLIELKERLAEKMDVRRTDAWRNDPKLREYADQLAIATRRYNAAVGSGLTTEAEELRSEIELTEGMIRAQQTVLGDDAFFTDAINELQRVIDETQRDLAADRRRTEAQLEQMQREVAAAQPEPAKLTDAQRAQAERLERRLAEVAVARQAHTTAADAAASGATAAAAAAERAADGPATKPAADAGDDELKQLEAASAELTTKVNDRKAQLAAEAQKRLVAQAEQGRLAELKKREGALAEAREAEVAAQNAFFAADRKSRDARARLDDARLAGERLDEHALERDRVQQELEQILANLEQKRAIAARQVEPVQPQERDVRIEPGEDRRPAYALAAAGGVVALFTLLMLVSAVGNRGSAAGDRAVYYGDGADGEDGIPFASATERGAFGADALDAAYGDNGNGRPAKRQRPADPHQARAANDHDVDEDEQRALS